MLCAMVGWVDADCAGAMSGAGASFSPNDFAGLRPTDDRSGIGSRFFSAV